MTFTKDLLERAIKAFVGAFLAAIVVPTTIFSASAWEAVGLAAAAGGISAVMSLLSKQVGDKNTASLLK